VTIETFYIWAKKFYAEVDERQAVEQKTKLTGRQLFESSPELVLSDVSFAEQDGETVVVDWSVFSKELDDSINQET